MFTPGPWKIAFGGMKGDRGFSIGSHNAAAKRIMMVAECWPRMIVDQEHRDELAANARLIAAAPDLLEALKHAVERMESVASGILVEKRQPGVSQATHVRHMAGHLEQHAKICRAAIDKATK